MDDEIGFPGIFETFGEVGDDRIETSWRRVWPCRVRFSHWPALPQCTAFLEFPAVMVVGGQARESGDLGAVGVAEFGDLGEQLSGGGITDSGHAGEDLALGVPVVIGLEKFSDGLFDDLELLVAHLDGLLNALQGDLSSSGLEPVFLHGSQLNELSSPGDKILKFLLVLRCFGCEWGLDELGELSEIAGVDGICLGSMSESLGEVPGLPRIDDGNRLTGVNEVTDEGSLIASGRFDDD